MLTRWASRHHPNVAADDQAFTLLRDRAPLILFAGDVGSGKSALAESFGCDLAEVLTTRGTGHVGEMTALVGDAFAKVIAEAKLGRSSSGKLLRPGSSCGGCLHGCGGP
ncbi:MAG: hypothetical protein H5T78_05210 [Nocardia sp.]|nr:hypothetical protein [Nocardia sp.]